MKFTVASRALRESLTLVGRVVPTRPIQPILQNILLRVDPDHLWIVGTDLEVMMISKLPADVEMPGEVTIPARLFVDVVANLPDGEKDRAEFGQTLEGPPGLELRCGQNLHYSLQVQGSETFPLVPPVEQEAMPGFTLPTATFQQRLREVEIAVGSEETNPVHRSVCFNFANRELTLVATDTKRLALSSLGGLDYPPEFQRSHLVPGKATRELVRLLDGGDNVEISRYQEQLVFTVGPTRLLTRLYEGKFPDHNRVIPKDPTRRLTMSRAALIAALRAVEPIARSASMVVRLDIAPTSVRAWSESRDAGSFEQHLAARLEGEPLNIAFNINYLQDFLSVVDTEEVTLEMTTPSYPGIMRPVAPNAQFLYVVMPMTL